MTDYERYKRRVELAERLGWTCYNKVSSGTKQWIPPGRLINPRNMARLPSLEVLEAKAAQMGIAL